MQCDFPKRVRERQKQKAVEPVESFDVSWVSWQENFQRQDVLRVKLKVNFGF